METMEETSQTSEAPEAPEAAAATTKRWYVVHTYSGHENKVKTNIERAIAQAGLSESVDRVLIPTESVAEMKNGKKTVSSKKFFPSYVLVHMDMSREAANIINDTPGVTKFVGYANKPTPLSGEEVERILSRIEGTKSKPIPDIPYRVGEHVRVVGGPFSEFTGVVEEINQERGKLKVMVSIFGRATPVELDFLQVKGL